MRRSQLPTNGAARPGWTAAAPTSAVADERLDRPVASRLKVLFVTEDDPLYVIRFFDVFLAEYPRAEFEICGITIDRAFHEPLWRTMLRLQRFYGVWGLSRLGIRFAHARLRGRTIKALAISAGVPIVAARSVNRRDYIERIRAIKPDAIVSVAAPEIFKAELLGVPRLGCINIHSGRLPAYRGMMPSFWQMQRGEPAVTITVHRMAEQLDAGDLLAMQTLEIKERDTLDRVVKRSKEISARLLIRVLRELMAGCARPSPIDMREAAYFSFPSRMDVQEFRRCGHRLL